ncbi:MAG: toxin-antitoxin system HicB family antitoxin [Bdellovibrionales bacterium]|nr:toxin-antitoxin system HicB family antitoxin [Bdellovibrionales bacterium]
MSLSGKFVLRVGEKLHRKLKSSAEHQGISLNEFCKKKLNHSFESQSLKFLSELNFKPLGLLKYGSVVRDEQTDSSDEDWLLVVPENIEIDRELYHDLDKIKLPGQNISMNLSHLPKKGDGISNFWLELALEAEILWELGSRIRNQLFQIRREIASGRYVRKLVHGQPYWIAAERSGIEKPTTR